MNVYLELSSSIGKTTIYLLTELPAMQRIQNPVNTPRQTKVHIPIRGEKGRGCDCKEAGPGLHRHLRVLQLRGEPGVPQLVLQGSSVLNQWTVLDLAPKLFRNFFVDMLSGATFRDLCRLTAKRLDTWMARGPTVCVIVGGTVNTVLNSEDIDICQEVKNLHEKIRKHDSQSFLAIALLTTPPRLRHNQQQSHRFQELQQAISQITLPGFTVLDLTGIGGRAAPTGNRFVSRPDASAFYEQPHQRGLHLKTEYMMEILFRIKLHLIQLPYHE